MNERGVSVFYFAGVTGTFGAAGACRVAGVVCPPVAGACCWLVPNPGVLFGLVVCVSVAVFSNTLWLLLARGAT